MSGQPRVRMGHAVRANGWGYWPRLIGNTARHYSKCGTRKALIRALWLVVVVGYYGEICEDCGSSYWDTLWWCPDNALWQAVHGGSGGLLCPSCFSRRADRTGVTLIWEPRPLIRESEAA